MWELFSPYETQDSDLEILATTYGLNFVQLLAEMSQVRDIIKLRNNRFTSFANMAQYVLTKWTSEQIPNLSILLSIGLVRPFATADCERSFSDMNRIKSAERSKLKDVLNSLMHIYSLRGRSDEFKKIKSDCLKKVRETVAHKIWKRGGYRRDSYYENIFIV